MMKFVYVILGEFAIFYHDLLFTFEWAENRDLRTFSPSRSKRRKNTPSWSRKAILPRSVTPASLAPIVAACAPGFAGGPHEPAHSSGRSVPRRSCFGDRRIRPKASSSEDHHTAEASRQSTGVWKIVCDAAP